MSKKWECYVHYPEDDDTTLSELGDDGWELVSVVGKCGGNYDVRYFKRELKDNVESDEEMDYWITFYDELAKASAQNVYTCMALNALKTHHDNDIGKTGCGRYDCGNKREDERKYNTPKQSEKTLEEASSVITDAVDSFMLAVKDSICVTSDEAIEWEKALGGFIDHVEKFPHDVCDCDGKREKQECMPTEKQFCEWAGSNPKMPVGRYDAFMAGAEIALENVRRDVFPYYFLEDIHRWQCIGCKKTSYTTIGFIHEDACFFKDGK